VLFRSTMLGNIRPELYEKIRFLQIGNTNVQWLRNQFQKYNLLDKLICRGFLARQKAIEQISDASILYIGLPSEKESGFSTGRIFYMLASGRPIMAAVPEKSEIANLVNLSVNGFTFRDKNMAEAIVYLSEKIEMNSKLAGKFEIVPSYAKKFTSEVMTQKFVDLIKSIT